MKRRFRFPFARFVCIVLVYVAPAFGCVPVETDHILAKHLSAANPAFAVLDADLEMGYAPRKGITRVFHIEEQVQIASRYRIALTDKLTDVCFVGAGPSRMASKPAGREVERGEQVAVEVSSGAARLTFIAEAASAGRTGESVVLKNPENGRLFSAKVQAKGKVAIQR
jgi:hypothetical protein